MKKLLSALIVFCLLLTMMPMSVWAEAVAKPQKGFELNVPVRVNPVYASSVDPQQLEEELDALSSAPVFLSSGYVTEDEAVALLREQMTRRVNNIVVKVKTTNNNANEVFNGIFDRALEHTGQPTEGDYLAWQYGGAGVGSGYDYDWDGQFCYYTLPYQITYYTTAAQEAELDVAIANLLSQWNAAGKSDYEKVSMINDYITGTVYYDNDNLGNPEYKLQYTAYAAMINKTSVCQGYANLFYRLALSLDVDCRIVVGWGYSGSSWGNHAWNLVEIDGTYYYSDPTWDASWAQAGWPYAWFLLGSENMGNDHEADPEYAAFLANYNISKTDYKSGEPSPEPDPDPDPTCGISQDEVYAAIIALKNDYPEGMPWNNSNSYRWNINNTIGYGCAGFAFLLSDAAFGHLPSRTIYDDITIDDLQVGDILRQYNDTHSVVVLEVHEDYVVLAEGNFNSSIHWGRTLTAAEVAETTDYLITRYPEHTFVDGVCTECGAQENQDTPDPEPEPEPTPEWPKTGVCGNNVTWSLTEDGVLTLSGTGSTWNYPDEYPGWHGYEDIIQSCVIEDGVTAIGDYLFYQCMVLTDIDIPDSVTSFGYGAFANCYSLNNVKIPVSVTYIDSGAFYNCSSLTDVHFGGFRSQWRQVTILDSNDPLIYATLHCSTPVPDQWPVTGRCGDNVSWSLSENGVLTISGTGYTWDYPEEYPGWDDYVEIIQKCVIEEGISSIGVYLFYDCATLTSVEIPCSVLYINENAFTSCYALKDVYYNGSERMWARIAIEEGNDLLYNATIHSSDDALAWPVTGRCGDNLTWSLSEDGVLTLSGTGSTWDYPEEYPTWYPYVDYINKCVVEEGVTTIGYCLFFNSDALTSVDLPSSLNYIGEGAFASCINLTEVIIPDGVETIEAGAFFQCTSLANVDIPDSVTYIGGKAFSYCTSLTSVELPDGITSVNPYTFDSCSNLTTVTIPSSVTLIDEYAFSNCNRLTDVYYKGTAEQWAQVRIDGTNTRLLYVNFHFVVATHTPGDINGDGKVNSRDATRLFQHLAGWDVDVNKDALDVNGDGKVNNRDATLLFQYLAGWNVKLH